MRKVFISFFVLMLSSACLSKELKFGLEHKVIFTRDDFLMGANGSLAYIRVNPINFIGFELAFGRLSNHHLETDTFLPYNQFSRLRDVEPNVGNIYINIQSASFIFEKVLKHAKTSHRSLFLGIGISHYRTTVKLTPESVQNLAQYVTDNDFHFHQVLQSSEFAPCLKVGVDFSLSTLISAQISIEYTTFYPELTFELKDQYNKKIRSGNIASVRDTLFFNLGLCFKI